ncbi:IS1096 element passenger TnpR family protein [Bradyrhizobium sp. HKCCYLS20291]|uniref:IS1096 element passenger TnpR family protein n=1 Tax=Bradyrhizobium sp. HKCCYLS20291 TaxID=3420766 RepID=UPI003EBD7C90
MDIAQPNVRPGAFKPGGTECAVRVRLGRRRPQRVIACPLLLEAAARCPPEDVHGAPGYARMSGRHQRPCSSAHPEHEHMRRWGPEQFDPNVVDRKALEAAVKALCDKWKPRRRATRAK